MRRFYIYTLPLCFVGLLGCSYAQPEYGGYPYGQQVLAPVYSGQAVIDRAVVGRLVHRQERQYNKIQQRYNQRKKVRQFRARGRYRR